MIAHERYLEAQRRMTKQYIDMDPTTIVLTPKVRHHDDAGMEVWEDGTPRPPQVFKLISIQFTPSQNVPTLTLDGVEYTIGFYLLGEWGAQMAVRDWWIGADGRIYRIIALMDGHGFEAKAAVQASGE